MLPYRKRNSILLAFLGMVLLLAVIPTLSTAARQVDEPLPAPMAPEPYPNTDVYPAVILLESVDDLQALYRLDIDIGSLQPAVGTFRNPSAPFEPSIATVYINPSQSDKLSQAGLVPVPIPNEGYRSFLAHGPGSGEPEAWPTFAEYVTRMQNLENAHPGIVDLQQIGTSVDGRGLYCMQITDNPGVDEAEPEFKYTANHHGDETTGVEMTMRLAELLATSYGVDPALSDMVDKMEIWLCPIYNPDGYELVQRYNAHGVDLNRDFPDRFTDPIDDPTGREPETQAFMVFGFNHRFVMGANYHGGAQVLNYPWDAIGPPLKLIAPTLPFDNYAPDDALFFDLGYGYTSRNSDLWNGGWPNGMVRGWQWYQIWGGMQDWAYYYRGEHHVTLEISNTKNPPFTYMDGYWDRNREAMLWWMAQAMTGVGGLVLDARDSTPLDATVTLVGRGLPNTIRTDPDAGDFHRVIGAGTYTLQASAAGYQAQTGDVTVLTGSLASRDFLLCPENPWVVTGTVTDATSGEPLEATIEFLDSPQVVNSSPVDGSYSINVCPSTYTMRVSTPWHFPEERLVVVDHSQTQDFALLSTSNLSLSSKEASASQPLPAETVQYQVHVVNSGTAGTVLMTDTLPISVTWTGELSATQGIPTYDSGRILWQGEVAPSQPVTITYSVSVNQCLEAGTILLNIAEFTDGLSPLVTAKVQLEVANAAPSLPSSPVPVDGAQNQPISSTLSWAPAGDLNCDAITYDIAFGETSTPDIVATGLVEPNYDPGTLLEETSYYWYVIARDGLTQTQGPTWQFTTASSMQRIFLPLTLR